MSEAINFSEEEYMSERINFSWRWEAFLNGAERGGFFEGRGFCWRKEGREGGIFLLGGFVLGGGGGLEGVFSLEMEVWKEGGFFWRGLGFC